MAADRSEDGTAAQIILIDRLRQELQVARPRTGLLDRDSLRLGAVMALFAVVTGGSLLALGALAAVWLSGYR